MKAKLSIIAIIIFLFAGCATTGQAPPQMTPAQEDALCRLTGNGLAETLRLVKPDYIAPAKAFCGMFRQARSAIEAKTVLESALTFLSDKYTKGSKLGNVVLNALVVIGYDEGKAKDMLFKTTDAGVKIDGFTAEIWRKANLVVGGFCQML